MKKQVSRRDKVLQTALKMISEGGFHNSPMSELAERSGVAVGTIYHHFDSKEILIRALYASCVERVSAAVMLNTESKTSPSKRFAAMWLNLHTWYSKNPMEYSFMRQFESSPFISEKNQSADVFSAAVNDVFKEGIKSGKLRKLKPAALAGLFAGMVSTAVAMETRDGKKMTSRELDELAAMSWAALKK